MTTPPGALTPYITPAILTQAPTGISWNTIPFGTQVTPQQRASEQWNICGRATAMIEGYVNQVLRCVLDTEFLQGPNYYVTVQQYTGNIRAIMSRWPILDIASVQVSPNTFPRQWTTLTSGYWAPETPVIGTYGTTAAGGSAQGSQTIIFSSQAGGGWCLGRDGFAFQVQYYSGWPHTGLTADVAEGSSTLPVNDCTGWALSSGLTSLQTTRATIYDPGGAEEVILATAASATTGPGTLTLSSPTVYEHPAGTMISTLPGSIQWAAVLFATSIALTRGATATTVQAIPGGSPALAGKGPESLAQEAELLLHSYRRVI